MIELEVTMNLYERIDKALTFLKDKKESEPFSKFKNTIAGNWF